MKTTIGIAAYFFSISLTLGEMTVLVNHTGSVQLPPGYINVGAPGGIPRPKNETNSVFTKGKERVDFNTENKGKLSLYAQQYFPNQKKILSNWTSQINGQKVSVLVWDSVNVPGHGGAVVSYPDLEVDFACDYINQGHLANFMFIALSYKEPNKAEMATPRKPSD